jgi:hypothetical protein
MSPNPGQGLNLEDEVEPGNASPTQGLDESKQAAPATTKAPAPTISDDDADFGNEEDYRRPGELDFFKVPEKNTFGRFSILINPATGKAFMKKGFIHYVKGKGYARCLSKRDVKNNIVGEPACCCKIKDAEPRYAALIVQYLSIDTRTGKFLKDVPVTFEVKACMLSRIGYKEISTLPNEDMKTTDLDILATPNENGKGLHFTRFQDKPSYTKQAALNTAVTEAMKPFLDGKELQRKVGKQINVAEMKIHMGIGMGVDEDGPGMEDLD